MFIPINDHVHHVGLAGSEQAPPLVLLHSLGTSSALWQAQMAAFACSHRVICPDFRGHGLSELSATRLSIETLAGDMLAILETLDISRFAMAGISLGGVVAQAVAAAAGDRLSGLTLFDSYVLSQNPAMWTDRAAKVRRDGLGAISEAVLSLWMSPAERADTDGRGLARMLATTPDEGYASGCDALANADNRARVGGIHAPTVVACGALDRAAPPEASRVLAAMIPGARIEIIEGAGHIPVLHHARQCTEIIRSVL
ncbi:MAG: alpha/beta fold hydrolase [Pararhodobacter sp.]|nr:alpha/beta fold hydrolase [Pararhodobacter sp.]